MSSSFNHEWVRHDYHDPPPRAPFLDTLLYISTPKLQPFRKSHTSIAQLEDTIKELRGGAVHNDELTFDEAGQLGSVNFTSSIPSLHLPDLSDRQSATTFEDQSFAQNEMIQLGLFEQAPTAQLKEML